MAQTFSNLANYWAKDEGSNKLVAGAAVATAGTGAVIVYQNQKFHQDKMKQNQPVVDARVTKDNAIANYYDVLAKSIEQKKSLNKYQAAKDVKPIYSKSESSENLRGGGMGQTNEMHKNNEMDNNVVCQNDKPIQHSAVPSSPPVYSYQSRNLYTDYTLIFLAGAFGFMGVMVLFNKGIEKIFPNKLQFQAKKNMEFEIENSVKSLETQEAI